MASTTVAGQRGFRHELLLHRSTQELREFVVPMVREGVAAQDPTLLLVRPDTAEAARMAAAVGPDQDEADRGERSDSGRAARDEPSAQGRAPASDTNSHDQPKPGSLERPFGGSRLSTGAARRMLDEHHTDEHGRCAGCPRPGHGTP